MLTIQKYYLACKRLHQTCQITRTKYSGVLVPKIRNDETFKKEILKYGALNAQIHKKLEHVSFSHLKVIDGVVDI